MSTVVVVVVVAAVAVGAGLGLLGYLRGGPGGGRATYRTTQEVDRERLDRRMRRDRTFEEAEEEFQQRRPPPTHEEP